jgi:RNA polymerase sigma-70 factor (ECF subfamily)
MMTETTFNEVAAILDAQQGDRAAFGSLVKAYQKRAYAIAYGFVGNREDALELAQESFVKAYRAISRFDTTMPFYPWLYRIVRNTCLNHIKKRKRRGESSLDGMMESGFDVSSGRDEPAREAALGDIREAVGNALSRLSDDHREIITLRHIHELSYVEIAECLDIPQGTVMSRLHAARRSLREKLMDIDLQPLAASPGTFS